VSGEQPCLAPQRSACAKSVSPSASKSPFDGLSLKLRNKMERKKGVPATVDRLSTSEANGLLSNVKADLQREGNCVKFVFNNRLESIATGAKGQNTTTLTRVSIELSLFSPKARLNPTSTLRLGQQFPQPISRQSRAALPKSNLRGFSVDIKIVFNLDRLRNCSPIFRRGQKLNLTRGFDGGPRQTVRQS
jgi:hypothetical protein